MVNNIYVKNNIHNSEDPYFGYKIVAPEEKDHYTDEDIKEMIESLDGQYDQEEHGDGLYHTEYPLQKMINIVMHKGGECYWRELLTKADIDLHYSREMLVEMLNNGFKYVGRIIGKANRIVFYNYIEELSERYFIEDVSELYHSMVEIEEGTEFNWIDGYEKLPKGNSSIFFSSVPIILNNGSHYLTPIGSAIATIDYFENKKENIVREKERIEIEEEKEHVKHMAAINNRLEAYFRSQGVNQKQIDQMLGKNR